MDEKKKKSLETAINQIEKSYGKGAIMRLGDREQMNVEAIPTGSLALDVALGIGGIPKGRVVEIYGPESSGKTTVALHMCAEVQKADGVAAFVDAEHALDPVYAEHIGVDVNNLYISQPDSGEQALEITETMVRSGAVDIVVVDSVAALVPKAEIDGEMGDSHIGLQARLMSQALRKLTSAVSQSNCTIIFINQLREKVGVMFGCLHADTLINFTDGRSIPIKEVVENKTKGTVWSYNEKNNVFEPKEIIDWHYNGDVNSIEDFIHFETSSLDSLGGHAGFTITPNHKIMTNKGWKEAKDILLDDFVLTKYKSIINNTLGDFLWGTFIGDSTISIRNRNTACLKFQDTQNKEYLNWKLSKLSPFFEFKKNGNKYETSYSSELAILKKELGKRNPLVMLKYHYSHLGLALWYMDDGHGDFNNSHCRASISVKRFKKDIALINAISNQLSELGFNNKISKDGTIRFDKKSSDLLFSTIAQYVPEPMQYKLPNKYKNKYKDFKLKNTEETKSAFVPILLIRPCSKKQFKKKGKYDISIKDNHNYMVGSKHNGIIVHNSPETTSGGRALKYYASVRLDVRRIESIKKNGEFCGNRVRIKVVKNKVAPPFKEAITEITFGKGVDRIGELVDMAVDRNLIEKGGAWYTYNDQRFQGRDNTKHFFEENPKEFEALEIAVRELCFPSEDKEVVKE